jgi:hypothetical protein
LKEHETNNGNFSTKKQFLHEKVGFGKSSAQISAPIKYAQIFEDVGADVGADNLTEI